MTVLLYILFALIAIAFLYFLIRVGAIELLFNILGAVLSIFLGGGSNSGGSSSGSSGSSGGFGGGSSGGGGSSDDW